MLAAARIPLSAPAVVHCARYVADTYDVLEDARRAVVAAGSGQSLADAPLPAPRIDPTPSLLVFRIAAPPASFAQDGLTLVEQTTLLPQPADSTTPPADKRLLLSYFLDAVRAFVVDAIVVAATPSRALRRFRSGILIAQTSLSSDWDYASILRPLVFCHIHIHFAYDTAGHPTHLIVHPILQSTPLLDLPRSLPLPPGSPILLLPYGTPAYYLSTYSGPTAALAKLFSASLHGLGAGDWQNPSPRSICSQSQPSLSSSPTFIIGWIKVENKHGEDKGTTFIYPTALCLSYLPLASSRLPLDCIPDLPAPLQPSPYVPPALPGISRPDLLPDSSPPAKRPSILSSPTSESLHAFRALTVSKKDLRQGAAEVSGYVDAVARERERERERMKREREGGTSASPRLSRATVPTPAPAPVPAPMVVDNIPPPPPPAPPPQTAIPAMAPLPPQTIHPVQNFYPSPPQIPPTTTSVDSKTSPTIDGIQTFSIEESMSVDPQPPQAPLPTAGPSTKFDPFETAWAQPADNYLAMDMDFGMDDMAMNFGMSGMGDAGTGGASFNESRMDLTSAFTDDDFSFFDRPTRSNPVSSTFASTHSRGASNIAAPLATSALPANSDISSSLFDELAANAHSSTLHHQPLFTPTQLTDTFTPRSIDHHDYNHPAEHLPSPGRTPDNHSLPSTPSVQIEHHGPNKRPSTVASNVFEPIRFSQYHRQVDDKYSSGKFAFQLPSPPAEIDLPETLGPVPVSPSAHNWRLRYDAITDPRIGIVRRLIGVKRRVPAQGSRNPPKRAFFERHEDWDITSQTEKVEEEDPKSDVESEEDDDVDDTETPLMSRPTTPPPSYLPLGPTLLHTQFHHSQLLPLSVPLRSSGSVTVSINIANHPPPSVPTPVSPAATLGAASERSKSLEAAARAIATEVVQNPLWAHTWRALSTGSKITQSSIWHTDVKAFANLFDSVPWLDAKLDVKALFGLDSENPIQPLETPKVSIAKGDTIIDTLPTALRFWEKLGLGPKSGRKDALLYTLYDDEEEGRTDQVESWVSSLSSIYQARHFGSLSQSSGRGSNALFPLKFDASFRKTFTSFVSSLESIQDPIVVLLVLPVSLMTLSSPLLRQIISTRKRVLQDSDLSILFEFVPEHFITGPSRSSSYDSALEVFALSLYDRILVTVERPESRRIQPHEDQLQRYFLAPPFTLARPLHSKVSYVRSATTSLDVVDRFTMLHVGYQVSACGKWILACCIDQRGESYDLGVWLTQPLGDQGDPTEEEFIIRKVWEFATNFAAAANIEWRIVIARLGVMSPREWDAWNDYLQTYVLGASEQLRVPYHVSLMCVETDAPWSFLTPLKPQAPQSSRSPLQRSVSSPTKPQTVFTDTSTITYAIYPTTRMPISLPPSQIELGLSQSHISEPPSTEPSQPSSPDSFTAPSEIYQPTVAPHNMLLPNQVSRSGTPSVGLVDLSGSEQEPHPITFLPEHSSILVHVPNNGPPSLIAMTQIHLLKTLHSESYKRSLQATSSAACPSEEQLQADVTKNYHELAVLSRTRFKLGVGIAGAAIGTGVHPHLPFHLAAVDAMRMALDRDWDRLEASGDM